MITMIIGNAGSGKSYYLKKICNNDLLLENTYRDNYYKYLISNLNKKRILIDDMIDYLTASEVKDFLGLVNANNIDLVITSTNCEIMLMVDKIIVIHNHNILIEGTAREILKETRLFNNLGIKLPFVVQLSNELKDYSMIGNICYNNISLMEELWK